MTDGQVDLIDALLKKEYYLSNGFNRIQIIAPTQYGKSNTIAMGLLIRAVIRNERWAIVTGSQPKSDVIMGKVIEHLFDHKVFYSELEFDTQEVLDRLKRERSKQNLVFRGGGAIRTFAADSRNRGRVKESLMGFGSPNIVEDESALIPDDLQSTVLRMLGGYDGGYLVKIGNPINRNHFHKTWNSEKYYKLFIDYHQALKEGRYTQEFIDEMKSEAFFDILYECKFPGEEEFDLEGYRRLLSDGEIMGAKGEKKHEGVLKLGFDVGEGGDSNVGVLRSNHYAEIVHESKISDLMATTRIIDGLIKEYKLSGDNVFVDATGIGSGVASRLNEIGHGIIGVKWGAKPKKDTFANLKAENYWDTRTWIKEGGILQGKDGFNELMIIKYKEDTQGRICMQGKDELRKKGIKSPNVADALAMTFNKNIEEEAPSIRFI